MRKITLLFVVVILISVLSGCGGSGGSSGGGDSYTVSGDNTLTPEIIGLLKAIGSAFVNEDIKALANCMDFPFSIINNYSDESYTFENYDESNNLLHIYIYTAIPLKNVL